VSSFLMTPDHALTHCRNHARALKGLLGHTPVQHADQLPPVTMMEVVASAMELADLFDKLDDHLSKGGGAAPADWANSSW
jgi:hypothetical protein